MRFRIVIRHTVIGTDQALYVTPMSAAEIGEMQGSALVALERAGTDEETRESPTEAMERTADIVVRHSFLDADARETAFSSVTAAIQELTLGQLNDLAFKVLEISGLGERERSTVARFQDETGENGSADVVPDGSQVREEAERIARGESGAAGD